MSNIIYSIKEYIFLSKEYGKPSQKYIPYFIKYISDITRSVNGQLVNAEQLAREINGLDDYWEDMQEQVRADKDNPQSVEFVERGKSDFYRYLGSKIKSDTTTEQIKQIIDSYTNYTENRFIVSSIDDKQTPIIEEPVAKVTKCRISLDTDYYAKNAVIVNHDGSIRIAINPIEGLATLLCGTIDNLVEFLSTVDNIEDFQLEDSNNRTAIRWEIRVAQN